MNTTSKHYQDISQKLRLIEQYGALSCEAALELVKDIPHCHTSGKKWELVTWIDLDKGIIYDVYHDVTGIEYTTYGANHYYYRFVKQEKQGSKFEAEDWWLLGQMRTRPDIYPYAEHME